MAIDPGYTSAKALVGWFRANETAHGCGPVSKADGAEDVGEAVPACVRDALIKMRCDGFRQRFGGGRGANGFIE